MSTGDRVIVAGAGPVGLVAAIALARHGLKPILIDAKREIAWSSRAVCISRRSLEIFARLGVTSAFFDKALPWSRGKTFHRDQLVFRLQMPFTDADRFAPFVNIQQYHTERFLLDTLENLGTDAADIRLGHAISQVTHHDHGGTVTIEGPAGRYDQPFDWMVAADGARSTVRSALGHALHGSSYEGRYLIADIRVNGADWPVERHVWFDPPSNPESTVILHVQPDGIWRIDIQVDPDQSDTAVLDDAFLVPLIDRHLKQVMGVHAPFEVIWRSVYRAHALSMDNYRDRSVLLAGDAAHLVPIFGVRGLNSGIDDAYNLAWKLAAVIEGSADPRLLDSYDDERRMATLENLGNAIKSTWFMSPPDAGFRTMRDAALRLAASEDWARALINPRQSAAHVYRWSRAIVHDQGGGALQPGAVLPSVRMADGSFLHDRLAAERLTLLILGDVPAEAADLSGKLGLHLATAPAGLFDDPSRLLLVRPDEHIAARFTAFDADRIGAAVRRALGWSPGGAAPFLPVGEAGELAPYTSAEALFARLAAIAGEGNDAIETAMAALSRGMAAGAGS